MVNSFSILMDLQVNEQVLFCGYGFEEEKDIIFQIQRKDGAIEKGHQVGQGRAGTTQRKMTWFAQSVAEKKIWRTWNATL